MGPRDSLSRSVMISRSPIAFQTLCPVLTISCMYSCKSSEILIKNRLKSAFCDRESGLRGVRMCRGTDAVIASAAKQSRDTCWIAAPAKGTPGQAKNYLRLLAMTNHVLTNFIIHTNLKHIHRLADTIFLCIDSCDVWIRQADA